MNQRAGNLHPLALPATEIASPLKNLSFKTVWQTLDHVPDRRVIACGDQPIIGNGLIPQGEIVTNGCCEEGNLLIDNGKGIRQDFFRDVIAQDTVEAYFAVPQGVVAADETGQSGLT